MRTATDDAKQQEQRALPAANMKGEASKGDVTVLVKPTTIPQQVDNGKSGTTEKAEDEKSSVSLNDRIRDLESLLPRLARIIEYTGPVVQSDDWATGYGINQCLERLLGDDVHIIDPDTSSVASPVDTNNDKALTGVINYIKMIGGYYTGGELIKNGFIHKDGGTLKKPVVMIWNTSSTKVTSSKATATTGGNHWQTCVILPVDYITPLKVKLGNRQEIVLFSDSLYQSKEIPELFRHVLTNKIKYKFSTDRGDITHELGGIFPKAEFISSNAEQQLEGYDCGWWAVYNALMFVLTGKTDFLQQFKERSRQSGYALRALLPGLDIEVAIGSTKALDQKGQGDKEERISELELRLIQHAIDESLRDLEGKEAGKDAPKIDFKWKGEQDEEDKILRGNGTGEDESRVVHALKKAINPMHPDTQKHLECIVKLGNIYKTKAITGTDRLDYAKATALYNYAINLCKIQNKAGYIQYLEYVADFEVQLETIEQDFLKSIGRGNITNEHNYRAVKNKHYDILWNIREVARKDVSDLGHMRDQLDKILATKNQPEIERKELEIAEYTRGIYQTIESQMKSFIVGLVEECQKVLGAAPCEYAIIGLGSLARGEMTPYSDLEFAILINYKSKAMHSKRSDENKSGIAELGGDLRHITIQSSNKETVLDSHDIKEYVRALTYYLYLKVINLGETILPVVSIESLNAVRFYDSITPRGFTFDALLPQGYKWPLGRKNISDKGKKLKDFELIGTPEEIAFYQIKEGYEVNLHLAEVLANAVFITGKEDLVENYKKLVIARLNSELTSGRKLYEERGLRLLKADIEQYPPVKFGEERILFNAKKEIYRLPEVILEGISLYYGVIKNNGWNKIEELADRRIIKEEAARNLKVVLSIATEIRLRTYLDNNRMAENVAVDKPLDIANKEQHILQAFSLGEPILFRYYHTALPLYNRIEQFVGIGEPSKTLFSRGDNLFDDSNENQGLIHYKLMQYGKAKELLASVVEHYHYTKKVYKYCTTVISNQTNQKHEGPKARDTNNLKNSHEKDILTKEDICNISSDEIVKHYHVREQESILKKKFENSNIVAITGIAGSGKTQMALRYACWYHREYPGYIVCKLFANSIESVKAGFRELANMIGLKDDQLEDIDAIKRNLSGKKGYLLFFDNVDEIKIIAEVLEKYLPNKLTNQQQVIITSQKRKFFSEHDKVLYIDGFSKNEVISFFSDISKVESSITEENYISQEQSVLDLADKLSYLPLAIAAAKLYMQKTGTSIERYIWMLEDESVRIEIEEIERDINTQYYPNKPIEYRYQRAVINLAINRNKEARIILNLCSMLNAEGIPRSLLLKWLLNQYTDERSAHAKLNRYLYDLENYSLLNIISDSRNVSIHNITQDSIRGQLFSEHKETEVVIDALKIINDNLECDRMKIESWKNTGELIPHALSVIKHAKRLNIMNIDNILSKMNIVLINNTNINSEEIFNQLTNEQEKYMELENKSINFLKLMCSIYYYLGRCYRRQETCMEAHEPLIKAKNLYEIYNLQDKALYAKILITISTNYLSLMHLFNGDKTNYVLIKLKQIAYNSLKEAKGEYDLDAIWANHQLGVDLYHYGKNSKNYEYIKQGILTLKETYNSYNRYDNDKCKFENAIVALNIAEFYSEQNERNNASTYYEKSYELFNASKSTSPDRYVILSAFASFCMNEQNIKRAKQLYLEAIQNYESNTKVQLYSRPLFVAYCYRGLSIIAYFDKNLDELIMYNSKCKDLVGKKFIPSKIIQFSEDIYNIATKKSFCWEDLKLKFDTELKSVGFVNKDRDRAGKVEEEKKNERPREHLETKDTTIGKDKKREREEANDNNRSKSEQRLAKKNKADRKDCKSARETMDAKRLNGTANVITLPNFNNKNNGAKNVGTKRKRAVFKSDGEDFSKAEASKFKTVVRSTAAINRNSVTRVKSNSIEPDPLSPSRSAFPAQPVSFVLQAVELPDPLAGALPVATTSMQSNNTANKLNLNYQTQPALRETRGNSKSDGRRMWPNSKPAVKPREI